MQPCAVCGGVTINATGHCTQCGTFRGNPAPEAPGGYGGYQQPAGGPGYQQPVSGPGYQQPISGPGYGQPAGGYPMSAPPGGYPASGPPAYPTTSGGSYPTSYPPLPPAGGSKSRPFVVPLVALSVTLVVIVVAIVVVVLVRGGSEPDGPVAGRTTPPVNPTGQAVNPDVDPCVVGRWRVISHREDVPMDDVGEVTFTGGDGTIVDLTAEGEGTNTYSGTSFEGTANGKSIKLQLDGTVEFGFTARDGTLSFKNLRANGTAKAFVDGEQVGTDDPLTGSDDPAKYTCSGSTLTQSTDLYETQLTKVG